MLFACSIPKATNTHSEYVIHIALHSNNVCTNTSQYSVIRALPVLFIFYASPPCKNCFPLCNVKLQKLKVRNFNISRCKARDVRDICVVLGCSPLCMSAFHLAVAARASLRSGTRCAGLVAVCINNDTALSLSVIESA